MMKGEDENMRVGGIFRSFLLTMPLLSAVAFAETSEIRVDLKLDGSDFVSGERIRGVVDIANPSPERISVGYSNSRDRFFIGVFRASDMQQLTRVSRHPFVARFRIDSSEGQKLETFLGKQPHCNGHDVLFCRVHLKPPF